ncbi:MAG: ClpXP protease specificity-enhancing factor [Nevskiales bacterium]
MVATSRRPYLIRAMFDWAVDNGLTPHLMVSADAPGVEVPRQFAQDGKITLNISPRAAQALSIGNDLITFSARFGGQPWQVRIPPGAVLAVYARENGEGVVFGEVETPGGAAPPESPAPGPAPGQPPKRGKPQLKVVK